MHQSKNLLSKPVYYPQTTNRNLKIPSFSANMTSPTNLYSHPVNFQGSNYQRPLVSSPNYTMNIQGKQNSFHSIAPKYKRSRVWEKIQRLLEKPIYYPEQVKYDKYSKINYYEGRQNYHLGQHSNLSNFKSLQHGHHHKVVSNRCLYHSEQDKYQKIYHVGKGDDYPNPPPPVSRIQKIPYMRRYYEYQPKQIIETICVPIQREIQDYYKIQHVTDFVPQQIQEVVVDYVPQQKIVERIQYIPIEQQIIHVPQQEFLNKGSTQTHLHQQVNKNYVGSLNHHHEIQGSYFNTQKTEIASPYFNFPQNQIRKEDNVKIQFKNAQTSQVVYGFQGVQGLKNHTQTQNVNNIKQYISSEPIPKQFANPNTTVRYQQANQQQNKQNISGFKVLEGQRFLGTISGSRYREMIDQGLINNNQSKQMYTGGQKLVQQPNPRQIYHGQQITRVSTINKNVTNVTNAGSTNLTNANNLMDNHLPQQDKYQQATLNRQGSSKVQQALGQLIQDTESVIRKGDSLNNE